MAELGFNTELCVVRCPFPSFPLPVQTAVACRIMCNGFIDELKP